MTSAPFHGLVRLAKDHDAAAADCADGYRAADIAAVTAFKGRHYRAEVKTLDLAFDANAAPLLAVLRAAQGRSRIAVLDFGGGAGVHHHLVRAFLPDLSLRWAVVEVPELVEACRGDEDEALRFFASVADALAWLGGAPDLTYSSGAVQYVPDPESTLAALAQVGAAWLMLARLPLLPTRRAVAVQQATLAACGVGPLPPGVPDRIVRFPVTLMHDPSVPAILAPAYRSVVRFASASGGFPDAGIPACAWLWQRG